MATIEIPRVAWTAALNDFSTAHEGWLVSLDVWTPEIGRLPEITDLPLLGIGAARTTDDTITISALASPTEQVSHNIHSALSLCVEERRSEGTAAVHVQSAGGIMTSLHLRLPPPSVRGRS